MAHHEPFKSLGPIQWSAVADRVTALSLPNFLSATFDDAQTLVDSVPGSSSCSDANALTKEWKEARVADNPHGLKMYRASPRDGRGTWFARRSVHRNVDFPTFRWGLEQEFEQTMRRAELKGGEPGTGNIRGLGAERRPERVEVEGAGMLRVFHLSVRFPGPTTPRDFVTLLLSSPHGSSPTDRSDPGRPRQFMLVSKPCSHPDCPPRRGFVRGQYESVEVIREIPRDRPLRQVHSSVDLSRGAADATDSPRPASIAGGEGEARAAGGEEGGEGGAGMAIEWIMITRSDAGGNIPRFVVDKGTIPGIVNDAGRFLDWLADARSDETGEEAQQAPQDKARGPREGGEEGGAAEKEAAGEETAEDEAAKDPERPPAAYGAAPAGIGGLTGMITSALGAAGSLVASRLYGNPDAATESSDPSTYEDDTSSEGSFASAEEAPPSPALAPAPAPAQAATGRAPASTAAGAAASVQSAASAESSQSSSHMARRHERALRKLEERQRRAWEKLTRSQQRAEDKAGRGGNAGADAAAAERRREKHAREAARLEEKFAREVLKLEGRRAADERKAERKREKAAGKAGRAEMQREVEKARRERDEAAREAEMLRDQVGELQAQNTLLVARLGKMGGLADAEAGLEVLSERIGAEGSKR